MKNLHRVVRANILTLFGKFVATFSLIFINDNLIQSLNSANALIMHAPLE